ncbi:hypothetical protein [Martelella soudanensis]|uniref:hypothetical protein n=1 Tax=unclassified Martelella TaxID=2629616 RepID=UPI0015DFB6AE|nr:MULTISPECIES: hypothetical protein [unclassified Martelella]
MVLRCGGFSLADMLFIFDKQLHRFPALSGDDPIHILGATILPQRLWVIGSAIFVFGGLWAFFTKTMTGKAAFNMPEIIRRRTSCRIKMPRIRNA